MRRARSRSSVPVITRDRGGWRVRQDHAVGTLRRLAALLAKVPTVACTGRCATRACRDLTVSALDIAHVRHATGHTLTTHGDHACSLLDDDGTCHAHERRPVIRGHAFVQNLRRGHYELGVDAFNDQVRVAAAFDELAQAI